GGDGIGGAILIVGPAKATVSYSTLSQNQAIGGAGATGSTGGDGQGGGLFVQDSGSASLLYSNVIGNEATGGVGRTAGLGQGGGIFNEGQLTVQHNLISGNSAGSAGGGLFNAASGTLAVQDSTAHTNGPLLGADLYNLRALTLDDSTVGVMGP